MNLVRLAALSCAISIFALPVNSLANPLDKLPEIANAQEGMTLISRDAFGPVKLSELRNEIQSDAVYERNFSKSTGDDDFFHGASLTENYGRISLGYMISIDDDAKDTRGLFNATKKQILEHFSVQNVGKYLGNHKLNEIQREYKWRWLEGEFECQVT